MKTAVVTGGGSGIGAAVADRLRTDGYNVAIVEIRAALGPSPSAVNAAGRDSFIPFLDISFEKWKKIVDINQHGVFPRRGMCLLHLRGSRLHHRPDPRGQRRTQHLSTMHDTTFHHDKT